MRFGIIKLKTLFSFASALTFHYLCALKSEGISNKSKKKIHDYSF